MKDAFLPQALKISQIIDENLTTKTFTLDGSLEARPGQFVMAWLPGLEEKPFSLAGADPIRLTIAAVGAFSEAVHRLQVGDLLWVRGPLGVGYELPARPQRILQVGGGYGVAPLYFLAETALLQGQQVSMIIGARSAPQLLLVEAFARLEVQTWLTTEDGSAGQQGRVTEAMKIIMADPQLRPEVVYACGPTGMLTVVAQVCQAETVPFQIAWEAHMRCGIGLCGSCEVGEGWLTCLDGPVFSFNPAVTPPP
jgi:dihydroorotate dehydrogenase electron transfer subunit